MMTTRRKGNKLTKEEILERFYKRWGKEEFDYKKSVFNGMREKIDIYHNICGTTFSQTPDCHIRLKYSCTTCANKIKGSYRAHTTETFVKALQTVHGTEEYDYNHVVYVNDETKIRIIHNFCGNEFLQGPYGHKSGSGCPDCYGSKRKTQEQFVAEAQAVHGKDEYDYKEAVYINNHTHVTLTHNVCGYIFYQIPICHINLGQGCPKCAGNITHTPPKNI